MDRALRIADGFVRTCQDLGLMTKSRAADAEAAIELEGQSITFIITEKVTRTERHEMSAQRRQRERAPYLLGPTAVVRLPFHRVLKSPLGRLWR
jgi:hypothetical protein